MSLKYMLGLAGLVAVAGCQGLTDQSLCSSFPVDGDNYRCVVGDPFDTQTPAPPADEDQSRVPAPDIHPPADEDA